MKMLSRDKIISYMLFGIFHATSPYFFVLVKKDGFHPTKRSVIMNIMKTILTRIDSQGSTDSPDPIPVRNSP